MVGLDRNMTAYYPTLLQIIPLSGSEAFTLPPFSTRNCTQTLEPIAGIGGGGNVLGTLIRRDINGQLVDLFPKQFRKYASLVTCKDVQSVSIDSGWFGQTVEVYCAIELSYLMGGAPGRPVVPGSSRNEGHYTYYRPLLIMKVVDIKNAFAEWQHDYSWQLGLQEV